MKRNPVVKTFKQRINLDLENLVQKEETESQISNKRVAKSTRVSTIPPHNPAPITTKFPKVIKPKHKKKSLENYYMEETGAKEERKMFHFYKQQRVMNEKIKAQRIKQRDQLLYNPINIRNLRMSKHMTINTNPNRAFPGKKSSMDHIIQQALMQTT